MMDGAAEQRVDAFLERWVGSQGNERANYQSFLQDWCGALGVATVLPKGGEDDSYCFDKDVVFFHKDKAATTNFIDLWRSMSFVFEAKQGSDGSTKASTPKRGTAGYLKYMEKAFYQARSYTRQFEVRPPFILTCDIGSHFELWQDFSGQFAMGYGARERIELEDFRKQEVFDRFVLIFNDPQSLNPEKVRARVTREVAAELAELARGLEGDSLSPLGSNQRDSKAERAGAVGRSANAVANFLMRCIFTMFAEDVGLLPGEVFTRSLRERWIPNPRQFKGEIEGLWETMNAGGRFGFERILRFNGGFFSDCSAFELTKGQLETLCRAADKDWSLVEPAIFGTLLERALDVRERSRLGAHYTPRSYVERLVKPVVMEPLRSQWAVVEMEVDRILQLEAGKLEPTVGQRKKAEGEIRSFLMTLQSVRILDPACGSGNFLYVTLDLLKTLEMEVLQRWVDVTGSVQLSVLEQVKPSQFLGIEVNPRAAAIAELVIWIGYLQWHFKRFGNAEPPEPVLVAYGNIECRDAVLEWDRTELILNEADKPITHWDGISYIIHPITGKKVLDETQRIQEQKYIKPRRREWAEADYIIGNPPFIGKINMRESLGSSYVESLRKVYKEVPDSADYVMYWWYQAAELLSSQKIKRFGFISTNSISQIYNRKVIQLYFRNKDPLSIIFAIPDHPWVETSDGANVRISMTAANLGKEKGKCLSIIHETYDSKSDSGEADLTFSEAIGEIQADLSVGIPILDALPLKSNFYLANTGLTQGSRGFILSSFEREKMTLSNSKNSDLIFKVLNGRDITDRNRGLYTIDTFGWSKEDLMYSSPEIYQHLFENVYPERQVNSDPKLRERWWLPRRSNEKLRQSISGLIRYLATSLTAKHRVFTFVDAEIRSEISIAIVASDDAYFLSILSSKVHVTWALAAGGTLEDRPRYNNSVCFDLSLFPIPPTHKNKPFVNWAIDWIAIAKPSKRTIPTSRLLECIIFSKKSAKANRLPIAIAITTTKRSSRR